MNLTEKTQNGIEYTEEIISCNGAAFILYPSRSHSPEMVKAAIAEIRSARDVVRIRIATEEDRDYLYCSEIFRHPECAELKWYEINQDEKLIRSERQKGTTVAKFVRCFVIPWVQETRERNLKKYGDKIIDY